MEANYEHKKWQSPPFSLSDLQDKPDEMLSGVTREMTAQIRGFFEECEREGTSIKGMSISWHNILNEEANPNGDFGFFLIVATRRAPYKDQSNGNIILPSPGNH